jgi:hypothetical protein
LATVLVPVVVYDVRGRAKEKAVLVAASHLTEAKKLEKKALVEARRGTWQRRS